MPTMYRNSISGSRERQIATLSFFACIFFTALPLVGIYSGIALDLSDSQWGGAFLFALILIFTLNYVNRVSILSVSSLFTLSVALFLGGRYLSALFPGDLDVFSYFNGFASYSLHATEKTHLYLLISSGLIALHAGQYAAKISFVRLTKVHHGTVDVLEARQLSLVLNVMWVVLAVSVGLMLYGKLMDVIRGGYLALYAYQESAAGESRIASLLITFLYVFLGIGAAYGDGAVKRRYILLFFAYSFMYLIMGGRGRFGAFLLFMLWMYGDFGRRKFSTLKFAVIATFVALFFSTFIQYFSYRTLDGGVGIFSALRGFLYTQGVTLMVFHLSTTVPSYPVVAYIQSLVPGVSFIASLFTDASASTMGFGQYLAYYLDKGTYAAGHGLGWSIFSDFYMFGLRSPVLLVLYFSFFGAAITKLELMAMRSLRMKALLITVLPALFLLPRSSLNSFVPLIWYFVVICWTLGVVCPRKVFHAPSDGESEDGA